jgi:methyl-accepting chemotaxis protein
MITRIKESYVLTLLAAMLGFGLFMGIIFPFVVTPFVEWREGMRTWFTLLSLTAGVIVAGVSILLVRTFLLKKIAIVGRQLSVLAEGRGHLTAQIDFSSQDELGNLVVSFNELLANLQSTMEQIAVVSDGLSDHADRTREMSQTLNEGGENKTQLVVDTAIAIDGLESTFQEIVDNLKELQGSSNESRVAAQGQVGQIEKVNEQVSLLLQHCQANTESTRAASEASHKTVRFSQELTTALTEAAASMTEMDRTVREIDRNLKETSSLSEKVALEAGAGKEATWKTQKGMTTISENFEASAQVIQSFTEKVKEIAAITEVIDEVTDQTNLLALNAAIIAAQAGEHGRGFAVVADQIKKLADKTSSSTREIGNLIKNFQQQGTKAIESTSQITGLIEDGVNLSLQAGGSLDSILESAASSHQQIQSLENAIKEIATTSHYLSEKVDSIAGRAREIAEANKDQEKSLAKVDATVTETVSVAGFLSESSREQLASSKKIQQQTGNVNRLVENAQGSIQKGEKETADLVEAIQKMQQLSRSESETMKLLNEEGETIATLFRNLRELVEKVSPASGHSAD